MTPRQQLEKFLAKYEPAIVAQAKKALAKMRKLAPGAVEMVYDNYNALVIGFAPGERPSEALFSIVLYPRYIGLCFIWGKGTAGPRQTVARQRQSGALDPPGIPGHAGRTRGPGIDSPSPSTGQSANQSKTAAAADDQGHLEETKAKAPLEEVSEKRHGLGNPKLGDLAYYEEEILSGTGVA
jgi:hypothetical protein